MAAKSGISVEEFIRRMREAAPKLAALAQQAPVVKGQSILGQLTHRIFNEGKDSNENQIGKYDDKRKQSFLTEKNFDSFTKKQQKKIQKLVENEQELTYKELRTLRGLQTNYVDLQFTGELFQSMNWTAGGNTLTLGITNPERARVSEYLETKYSKKIFTPSKNETELAVNEMVSYIREKTAEIFAEVVR